MATFPHRYILGVLLGATVAAQAAGCALTVPLLVAGGDELLKRQNGGQTQRLSASAADAPANASSTSVAIASTVQANPGDFQPGVVVRVGGQVFQTFGEASSRALTGKNFTDPAYGMYCVQVSGDASKDDLDREPTLPVFRLSLYFDKRDVNRSKLGIVEGDIAHMRATMNTVDNVMLMSAAAVAKLAERSGVMTTTSIQHVDSDADPSNAPIAKVYEAQGRLKMSVSIPHAHFVESETLEYVPKEAPKSLEKKVSDKAVEIEINLPFSSRSPD